MLEKIKNITKQKAQGIVEYALLLAFVVGIAMMLSGADLGDAITGVFDNVANVLAGSKYDLSTPEGRLAADKAKIKELGESLAKYFKHSSSSVDDPYADTKAENAQILKKNFVSVVVLPDGSLDVYFDGNGNQQTGWHTWYSSMTDEQKAYYASALKSVGIEYNDQTNKVTDQTKENFKLYSSSDGGTLQYGYGISFTKNDSNKMEIKYYSLSKEFTADQLGTDQVPRDGLSTGKSVTEYHQAYVLDVND